MDFWQNLFPISMALLAYTLVSTGLVLMKKGIGCFGWQGPKTKSYYQSLGGWILGFVIMNGFGIPSAIALKQLPPHIVAAFAGWGIVVLVFLSFFLLKEKIYKEDFLFSAIIILGIVLLNIFEKSESGQTPQLLGLIVLTLIPVALFVTGLLPVFSQKAKTIIFGTVLGFSAGLMVVFLKILVLSYQYQIKLYFGSIYLYLYLSYALISLIALQLANKHGSIMIIGPVQYATTIFYPLLTAFVVFHDAINIVQIAAILLIVIGVIAILRKR